MSSSRSSARDGIDRLLPTAHRFIDARPESLAPAPYGGVLPPLPDSLRAAVREVWNIDVGHEPAAPDPLGSPAFATYFAAVRAEQVLLALSARTNLSLAGSTVVVAGDGALAGALASALGRIGARVVRCADAPLTVLAARLEGVEIGPSGDLGRLSAAAHVTLVTGEGGGPVPAASLSGVVADASASGAALLVTDAQASSRPHVRAVGAVSVVELPPPLPTAEAPPSPAQLLLADALVTGSLFGWDAPDADDRLAAAVTP